MFFFPRPLGYETMAIILTPCPYDPIRPLDYETMVRQCVAATQVIPVAGTPVSSGNHTEFVPFVCVRKERKQKPVRYGPMPIMLTPCPYHANTTTL